MSHSVLLVDDEPQIREMIRQGLEVLAEDYEVYDAEDGESAIEVMTERDIDVVVLDLQMPVTNGWETLRVIRDPENGWPDTKVVMLTVQDEMDTEFKAMTLEVDKFTPKRQLNLSKLVNTICSLARS